MVQLNDDNFEAEVLKYAGKVLVDFYADWCMPCQMLSPLVEAYAENHPDVKVCKLNVDEATPTAITYGVMSIPTLLRFDNGTLTDTSIGVLDEQELIDFMHE